MKTSARCAALILLAAMLPGCYVTRITKEPLATSYAPVKWDAVKFFSSIDEIPTGYEVLGKIRVKGEAGLLQGEELAAIVRRKAGALGANGVTMTYTSSPGSVGQIVSIFAPVVTLEVTATAVRYKDVPK